MLAFINIIAGKMIPVICVIFTLSAGHTARTVIHAVSPVISVFTQPETKEDSISGAKKTTSGDSLATGIKRPAKDDTGIIKYKDRIKKSSGGRDKSIRISISDKGVKVGSEDGEEVFLHMDTERLTRDLEDVLNDDEINLILDGMIDLSSDSGSSDVEDRDFKVIRNDQFVRFGEDIHIGRNEMVRGDVVAIFGDIEVEGKVTGDVVSIIGDIDIGENAIVNGEVVSVFGTLDQDDNANVRGQTVVVGGTPGFIGLPFVARFGSGLFNAIVKIVSFIAGTLLILLIIYFLPDRMRKSSDYVFGSFFKSFGVGILAILFGGIVMAIIAVILSITIIGIPVAILIVLSYIALIIMGYFVSSLAVGRIVAAKFNIGVDSLFIKGFIGFFVLSVPALLSAVMFINPIFFASGLLKLLSVFINLVAGFAGTGALIVSKAGLLDLKNRPKLPE